MANNLTLSGLNLHESNTTPNPQQSVDRVNTISNYESTYYTNDELEDLYDNDDLQNYENIDITQTYENSSNVMGNSEDVALFDWNTFNFGTSNN